MSHEFCGWWFRNPLVLSSALVHHFPLNFHVLDQQPLNTVLFSQAFRRGGGFRPFRSTLQNRQNPQKNKGEFSGRGGGGLYAQGLYLDPPRVVFIRPLSRFFKQIPLEKRNRLLTKSFIGFSRESRGLKSSDLDHHSPSSRVTTPRSWKKSFATNEFSITGGQKIGQAVFSCDKIGVKKTCQIFPPFFQDFYQFPPLFPPRTLAHKALPQTWP